MLRAMLLLCLCACRCGPPPADSTASDSAPRDSAPAAQNPCTEPQPILAKDGGETGYVRCADGSVNRVAAVPLTGDYRGDVPECEDWVSYTSCETDADCQDPAGGECALAGGNYGMPPFCECTWPCASDADCAATEICLPPEVHELPLRWPLCVRARCRTGESCPSGECALATRGDCGWGQAQLRCREHGDECRSNQECDGGVHFCWPQDGVMQCVYEACD
jgi:hypothetical protein